MSRKWLANPTPPRPSELPTPRTLALATVAVIALAVAVVVIAVLPAERGVDPTGLGRITGLTEMGQFKVEADKEFAAIAEAVAARRAADSAAVATPPAPPLE